MKKIFNIIVVLLLIVIFVAGCGSGGSGTESKSEEFLGKYSGPAGSIEFLPDGQIKVDFSDDNMWMVNSSSNNHTTLKYQFINKERKTVLYDKAEHISFSEVDKNTFFIVHPCKVTMDKIILHPGSVNEVVFNKVAD
ncbi:MAG: hypothetical protein PWQ67_2151 [Clostridia bacterium]|jgi:uncharacterized protein YcfL|nr:hypothetical protein [Clostridia bacterium]